MIIIKKLIELFLFFFFILLRTVTKYTVELKLRSDQPGNALCVGSGTKKDQ